MVCCTDNLVYCIFLMEGLANLLAHYRVTHCPGSGYDQIASFVGKDPLLAIYFPFRNRVRVLQATMHNSMTQETCTACVCSMAANRRLTIWLRVQSDIICSLDYRGVGLMSPGKRWGWFSTRLGAPRLPPLLATMAALLGWQDFHSMDCFRAAG